MFGNGDGTFGSPNVYQVGFEPYVVVAADLNLDGNLDLVTANYGSANVSVLLGKGDGTFQPTTEANTPQQPDFVAVGDFNGDKIPDLVVIDYLSDKDTVSVLLGNGNGTFQPPIDTVPPNTTFSIGLGDFNKDGKLDLVTGGFEGTTSAVGVLFGNGDGTFTPGETYSVIVRGEITIADLRGDGNLDIEMATGDSLGVMLGNGDGTFQLPTYYDTFDLAYPTWTTAADINNDGKLDLLASTFANYGYLDVFLGNGDGTFQPATSYAVGVRLDSLVAGDLNNDGMIDVVVANQSLTVTSLLNTGVVTFSPTTPPTFPAQLINTASAPQTVQLTNTGGSDLSISSIKLQGQGFSMNSNCGSLVVPGSSCAIKVQFKPLVQGPASGLITLVDSASSKPQYIELIGSATTVSLSPKSLSFPNQKVGTRSSPKTVTLTNHGTSTLTITSIVGTGDDVEFPETNTCGTQVAAGASCTFSITFAPTIKGKSVAGWNVNDNGGASPQIINLTGTGD